MKTENPFNRFTKKTIKEAIENIEIYANGMKNHSGAYAVVTKIQYMTGKRIQAMGGVIHDVHYDKWFCMYNIKIGNDLEGYYRVTKDCYVLFDNLEHNIKGKEKGV